jgi:hypothetical protein
MANVPRIQSGLSIDLFTSETPLPKPPEFGLFSAFFTSATEENCPAPLSIRAWQEIIKRERLNAVARLIYVAATIITMATTLLGSLLLFSAHPITIALGCVILCGSLHNHINMPGCFAAFKKMNELAKSLTLTIILDKDHQTFFNQNEETLFQFDGEETDRINYLFKINRKITELQHYYRNLGIINSSDRLLVLSPYTSFMAGGDMHINFTQVAAQIDDHFPHDPFDYVRIQSQARQIISLSANVHSLRHQLEDASRPRPQITTIGEGTAPAA